MHAELRVAQLIYARVERDYSPQRKSGFQTVCRSASLTPAEVSAIEKRVQCFQQQSDIIRRQFFRLDSGKVVLSQTRLLTRPDTTIIDSSGRMGAFIAHCIILTPSQFAECDNNPFAIFERYAWQSDPQEMVDHIERTAADGYHTLMRVVSAGDLSSDWPIAQARKLVALALQCEDLAKKEQSILMVGDQDDIEAALRTAFALMPAARRPLCSFDTCIDRCGVRPGLYWAVGASARQSSSDYIGVDPRARRVEGGPDVAGASDLYLAWLNAAGDRGTIDEAFMSRARTIQALSRAFSQGQPLPHTPLDEGACGEFFELHRARVTQNLKVALNAWRAASLAAPLIEYLYQVVEPDERQMLLAIAAQRQIDADMLSDCLVEWIDVKRPILKESDWRDILEILSSTGGMEKLARLEVYILGLDDAELNALEKSVKKRADIPPQYQELIERRRNELGSKPGLLGFLRRH